MPVTLLFALAAGLYLFTPVIGSADAAEADKVVHSEQGEASWYGRRFAGKETSSGLTYDPSKLTAAHPDLPLGTTVKVTNLENGKSVEVEIIDRGPLAGDRVIDLSKAAADQLDMLEEGTVRVRIEATARQIEEGKTDAVGGDEASKRSTKKAD